MPSVSILTAFTAGLVSFLAPCTFVTLPYFITYLTSESFGLIDKSDTSYRAKILYSSLAYILGFILIFVLLGITATQIGMYAAVNREVFRIIGGLTIIAFGIFMLAGDRLKLFHPLQRTKKINHASFTYVNSYIAPFLIGITSAFAWTPCIGPILGSILFLASYSSSTALEGGLLLMAYAFGITLPFFIFSLFFSYGERFIRKVGKYTHIVYKISAVIMIILGVTVVTGYSDTIFGEVYRVFIELGYNPQ
jgi:cytochrome c-type biogenesis protein